VMHWNHISPKTPMHDSGKCVVNTADKDHHLSSDAISNAL
jgi:hypothetical protein